MPLFTAKEKVYFVFSGMGEKYYLDSGIQLTESAKLWMELRASQFTNVYFVSGADRQFTIRVLDDASKQTYNSGTYGILGPKRPLIPREAMKVTVDDKLLWKWLVEILAKMEAGSCAVVMPFSCLTDLFQNNPSSKNLDQIIRRGQNQCSLLIQFPMRIREEQHRMLIGRDGIFGYTTSDGLSLCETLTELISSRTPVYIYKLLKQRIGDAFVELNPVTYAGLQSLLRCVRFQRGEWWSEDSLNLYTNVLFNWWYLADVEAVTNLPPNFIRFWTEYLFSLRKRDDIYAALNEVLCSPNGWKAFQDRVARLTEQMDPQTVNAFLYSLERSKAEQKCHVTIAHPQLFDISHIPWPGEIYDQIAGAHSVINISTKERWKAMQISLLAPTNHSILPERLRLIETFHEYYLKALALHDYDTLCRAINAMQYAGSCLYAESGEEYGYDKRFSAYERCLHVSRECFGLNSENPSAAGSVFDQGFRMAHQKMEETYRKYLNAMDTYLRFSPQSYLTLTLEDIESEVRQLTRFSETSQETESTELYVDNTPMTVEEADAWLRENTNKI